MDNDTLFKILAIVSPFISGVITYLLTQRSKKSEYLYQNRIPAFKEILPVLIKIKKYAIGKIALYTGSEFSPYHDEEGSSLMLRTELANIGDANEVFLTDKSKGLIADVDSQLGLFCNAELSFPNIKIESENPDLEMIDYRPLLDVIEKCIRGLYSEVGLPNK
jgi:hypothetical protein